MSRRIVIDDLCSVAHHQQIYFLWRPVLRDPCGDHVGEGDEGGRCHEWWRHSHDIGFCEKSLSHNKPALRWINEDPGFSGRHPLPLVREATGARWYRCGRPTRRAPFQPRRSLSHLHGLRAECPHASPCASSGVASAAVAAPAWVLCESVPLAIPLDVLSAVSSEVPSTDSAALGSVLTGGGVRCAQTSSLTAPSHLVWADVSPSTLVFTRRGWRLACQGNRGGNTSQGPGRSVPAALRGLLSGAGEWSVAGSSSLRPEGGRAHRAVRASRSVYYASVGD
jgi:hypothetical protein